MIETPLQQKIRRAIEVEHSNVVIEWNEAQPYRSHYTARNKSLNCESSGIAGLAILRVKGNWRRITKENYGISIEDWSFIRDLDIEIIEMEAEKTLKRWTI